MDERHWQMVVRFFSGEASPAERDEVRRWAGEDPAHAAELQALRTVWEASGRLPARGNADAAWARIAERTGIGAGDGAKVISIAARRKAPARWTATALRIAALVVVTLGASLLIPQVRDAAANRTVTTGKGERIRLVLDDGTRVDLGVESRLTIPRWFRRDRRDVRLQGAAYFQVAHDVRRPFTVYTADAVTRVLGTKFSVRDYPHEPARIAVTEGRVAVSGSRAPADDRLAAILVKGEAAEVTARGAPAVIRRADETREIAWTRGTITFQNAPVREVAAEIGRWYDVELQVPDTALAERHLTIEFDNEPLETVLRDMAAALNARVERRGLVVVLTPAPQARIEDHPAALTLSL